MWAVESMDYIEPDVSENFKYKLFAEVALRSSIHLSSFSFSSSLSFIAVVVVSSLTP